jgi:MOSC domain-containing protein YiiM
MPLHTQNTTHLLIKQTRGAALVPVESLQFSTTGIEGSIPTNPIRQVLLLQKNTVEKFKLQPGDIRENIIIDTDHLYELPSGTVIQIGDAKVRLTIHCEPCGRISPFVKPKNILHQRGYLGTFLNAGTLKLGDRFSVTNQQFEEIPYDLSDRIKWALDKTPSKPMSSKELLVTIGLSISYARALPALLKRLPAHYRNQVTFANQKRTKI